MVREVGIKERKSFNKLAAHPLQTWEWGEFREKTGVAVTRLGRYMNGKLVETASVTWHPIPKLPLVVGYWPKGAIPSVAMIAAVRKEAKLRGAIFVTMEPNVLAKEGRIKMKRLQNSFDLRRGRALFTKWSFWLNLEKSEAELLAEMKQRTRYNVRYAERKGVEVVEDNSIAAFEEYWQLSEETMKRQGFYAHTKHYHQLMFETLKGGIAHLFKSVYKGKTLTTWIVFVVNGVLYYPYGGSTREGSNVFPSDAMMWQVIRFGKKQKCYLFDMWGSPGPSPKPSDPWAGFHRFKLGYGAKLVEFVGSFDLVVNPLLYPLYRAGNELRWLYLRMGRK